jgi:hypothetical protein
MISSREAAADDMLTLFPTMAGLPPKRRDQSA